jgi:hypothetical protein
MPNAHSLTVRHPVALAGALLSLCGLGAQAGSLNAPAGPNDGGSAMYTITDVYNRIDDGTAGTKRTGTFTEPAAAPGATGYTLNQLYNLASQRARPAKTGQTTSYATGDDGALQKGVAWPNPRFTDNSNGTVTDNLSGLIWLKNANCFGNQTWANALATANTLNSGECGLNDGSAEGAWRLPNIKELQSLVDFGRSIPALPSVHPFSGVQSSNYWSSTSNAGDTSYAWGLGLGVGFVYRDGKAFGCFVWPVRGGQ